VDNDQLDAAAAEAGELLDELDELEESDEPDLDVELVLDEDESDDELVDSLLLEAPVLVFFPDSRLSVR
jgi:hypothetical protein